jgi:sporulation protein YlmC with PRC-barrel domain
MLKKHMAACLVATAFIAAPALAQTTSPPAASQPAGASASAQSGQFLTTMQPNQIRASKFSGVDIIGANNESIGDVNDVILDQQGMAQAVVIGVGGFLGIGEKNVAIPFKSVDWKWERRDVATTAGTRSDNAANRPAGTGAGTAGGGAATTGAANQPASGAATTGSTGAAGTGAGSSTMAGGNTGTSASGARGEANRGAPDHGVLRMTKADLQNAPNFSWDGDRNTDRGTGTGGTATGGAAGTGTNAPRQ